MAADYMNVRSSLDLNLHSKELFRKTMKRRPLGNIGIRQEVRAPRYPILSMNLVNVNDVAQKTTYRPTSSMDILEKQQEEFHKHCVRTVKSASLRRSKHSQEQSRRAPYTTIIQVQGEGASRAKNRPQSSPAAKLVTTTSWVNPAAKRPASERKRPKTGSSCSPSRTESRLTFLVDPEYNERNVAYHECESAISTHRSPEYHNLNSGIFIRGKKKDGAGDTQWLTFGGGVQSTGGVVDTFSVMKNSDEYFSIDGRTGTVIAKKLQKTDKVQIGINGKASKSSSSKALTHKQNVAAEEDPRRDIPDMDSALKIDDDQTSVPLCWGDQLKKPEAKVYEPTGDKKEHPRPIMSETKPVIFSKLIKEEQPAPTLISPRRMPSPDGYKVRQRTKVRKWLDGTDSNFMTILSIDTRGEENDKDLELIDYEKLINDKFQSRDAGKKFPKEGPGIYKNNLYRESTSLRNHSGRSSMARSTINSRVNSGIDPMSLVRPTSRSIQTKTLEDSPLKVTPHTPASRTKPTRTSVPQSPRQGLPQPQSGKIIRGKTSHKMGPTPPSISANYNQQGDTSYIQIIQGMATPPGLIGDAPAQHEASFTGRETLDSQEDQQKESYSTFYEQARPGMNTPISAENSSEQAVVNGQVKMAVDVPVVEMALSEPEVISVGDGEERKVTMEADEHDDAKDDGIDVADDDEDSEDEEKEDVNKTIPAPTPELTEDIPEQAPGSAEHQRPELDDAEFNISVSIKPRELSGDELQEGSVHSNSGRQTPEGIQD